MLQFFIQKCWESLKEAESVISLKTKLQISSLGQCLGTPTLLGI